MIKVLEKKVADKIAAGEVIERPASVIKELLENAVDAKAESITCEIKNGGKSYIRITDNGCGISDEDAETAFLRHATSKINSIEDLSTIKSLGFRGEALASIAAVSRVSLITKSKDSRTGTRLTIHGGTMIEHTRVGCPEGTTFLVTDLFYNTPARRAFLRSDNAESSQIADLVSRIAIANPEIRFQLVNNGRILFTSRGDGNLKNTILAVSGQQAYKDLVEFDQTEEGVRVRGCLSRPSLSRTTRRDQYFFVNGRTIKSKVLDKAIARGYKERLFEGRHPVVFLFLEMDPEDIDVNIHPNKTEIRFHDEKKTAEVVEKGIRKALESSDALTEGTSIYRARRTGNEDTSIGASFVRETPTYGTHHNLKDFHPEQIEQVDVKSLLSSRRREQEEVRNFVQEPETASRPRITIDPPESKPFDPSELTVTGAIFDTYITATDADAFYLIDQHAAQERIFYEKLVGEYLSDTKPGQTILTPILLEVPLEVSESGYDWRDSLCDMGYRLEDFGPGTYLIKEIPYFMDISEAEAFAKDFTDDIRENDDLQNSVVINKLITTSCKRSVKAHDHLSQMEMEALLADLARCRNPFSCPHGRPTIIRFSQYEIEKMFKRIV